MNAGLPGAGIGVAYYLILIIIMPFAQLAGLRKRFFRKNGWKQVLKQIAISSGVLLGITGGIVLTIFLHPLIRQNIVTQIFANENGLFFLKYSIPFIMSLTFIFAVILKLMDSLLRVEAIFHRMKNRTNIKM